ncbi:ArsR/SmtB family transcription factor [Kordiimonas gwangyangensis]|uniref:ArsR/SmtB family transcription factor n=1 Tax=Kordiimonas gwangyangensis TaxID=288022 RepID=UPI0003786C94|nr:metalloregulator ArsR/SmtB family transcription factor [Kordiimonas gwangyangensis]
MANYQATLDHVFHALADNTRRQVLERLARAPMTVSELARPFDMALPSFLQHLKVLEESGLIVTRKEGRVRTCEINASSLTPVEDWVSGQREVWSSRLDRLDALLMARASAEDSEEI